MRKFFSAAKPAGERILLVESGSRQVLERLLPRLEGAFGAGYRYDVVTCFPGLPRPLEARATGRYAVQEFPGWRGRLSLLSLLRAQRYAGVGIVFSGEPYLAPTKWLLLVGLPAKVFIINEYADLFWLDWRNLGNVRRLLALRQGLLGDSAVKKLARLLLLPPTFLYLLGYFLWLASRRWWRSLRTAAGSAALL